MPDARINKVGFVDADLEGVYEKLKSGRFEEKRLADFIERAMDDLKENPSVGIIVPKRIWPSEYVNKFGINSLRK